jgi:hypothetical protein
MGSNKIITDVGHSLIKAVRSNGNEITFPHQLAEITEHEYRQALALNRGQQSEDLISVQLDRTKRYFVVGNTAFHYRTTVYTGAERYKRDYYAVFVLSSIARLYSQNNLDVQLFASHPPGHVDYTEELIGCVSGRWLVQVGGRNYTINIGSVSVFDEPTGGLFNVLLTKNGKSYQHPELQKQNVLIMDIGGGTTDFVIMDRGQIIYTRAHTEPLGIKDVVQDFKGLFTARYKHAMRAMSSVDERQLLEAINTGYVEGGGTTLEAEQEATQARNLLLNKIRQVYTSNFGGFLRYHSILLTGGGSAYLYEHLFDVLEHDNILLAEDPDCMHLANVRGGLKLSNMLEHLGA